MKLLSLGNLPKTLILFEAFFKQGIYSSKIEVFNNESPRLKCIRRTAILKKSIKWNQFQLDSFPLPAY